MGCLRLIELIVGSIIGSTGFLRIDGFGKLDFNL